MTIRNASPSLLDRLEREGVVIRSGVNVIGIAHAGGTVTATIEAAGAEQTITGSHLLIATGTQADDRRPRSRCRGNSLRPLRHCREPKAQDEQPARLRDRRLRGRAFAAYARGQLSRRSGHSERAVPSAGAGRTTRAVPWATYTEPELAHAGLTEAQARTRRIKIRIARWPYNDNDRAQTEHETRAVTLKSSRRER